MLSNQVALKYAQAAYELAAEKNKLDLAQQQLEMVASTICEHAELSDLFYHPRVPAAAKKEILQQIFAGQLEDFLNKFLLVLVDKSRENLLPAIVGEYVRLANEERNITEADVVTAFALTENQLAALATKLGQVTGKTVLLKTHVDKQILGGIVIKMGDKLIDGSVQRQLRSLQSDLLAQ
ncbi:MAG TPA: F0F1 ATP synthase subunit delta [Patescibacteria group bacterium]|nr:F0F1 ATP synthase subunit delta [Patescibacteria group bacterium]